jgi:hypothetical protein
MKLGPKLIISLGLSLAVILGVFMLFMIRHQRDAAIEQASHMMLTVGQAIVKSMERSMRQGDMTSIQETIESMAGGDIAGLRIINWGRAVTQSDKPGEIGSRADGALVDEAFRTGLPARTDSPLGAACARSSPRNSPVHGLPPAGGPERCSGGRPGAEVDSSASTSP